MSATVKEVSKIGERDLGTSVLKGTFKCGKKTYESIRPDLQSVSRKGAKMFE